MRERIETITDSFVDYLGKTHHFVIAAISQSLPTKVKHLENPPITDSEEEVYHEVGVYINGYGTEDYLGTVTKAIKLGVAICNPEDVFDEKVGTLKAVDRARNSNPVIFSTHPGYINTALVKALLEQEATYLKTNPGNFIVGYEESYKKHLYNAKMVKMYEGFSDFDKQAMDKLDKDPNAFSDIVQYMEWKKKQEKGNQKKSNTEV